MLMHGQSPIAREPYQNVSAGYVYGRRVGVRGDQLAMRSKTQASGR
jgi:hypothetical protein